MKSGTCAVSGINHITLPVRALDISLSFYVEVLGMVPVARWYKGAYLLAGDMWVALTLDSETRTSPPMEYTHIAFHVPGQDFAELERRIRNSGAPIWQENRSQGDSLYVLDPDHHKIEIHCSDLSARLDALKLQPPKDLVLYPPAQDKRHLSAVCVIPEYRSEPCRKLVNPQKPPNPHHSREFAWRTSYLPFSIMERENKPSSKPSRLQASVTPLRRRIYL